MDYGITLIVKEQVTLQTTGASQSAISLKNCQLDVYGKGSFNIISTNGVGIQGQSNPEYCAFEFCVKESTITSSRENLRDLSYVKITDPRNYDFSDCLLTLKAPTTSGVAHVTNVGEWQREHCRVISPSNMSLDDIGNSAYSRNDIKIAYVGVAAEINATNFPDPVFRNDVSTHYDANHDGYLSYVESAATKEISLSHEKSLTSLKGVEFFTELKVLNVTYNSLASLDLSKNTKLTDLSCSGNHLTELNLSKNTYLKTLVCNNNQLSALDLGNNEVLSYLDCSENRLTSLTILSRSIEWLLCFDNQLDVLDLPTYYNRLEHLECYKNRLTTLNLKYCSSLSSLNCHTNQIDGDGAQQMVNNLPRKSSPTEFAFKFTAADANNLTPEQVAIAQGKNWIPRWYNGAAWDTYTGIIHTVQFHINDTVILEDDITTIPIFVTHDIDQVMGFRLAVSLSEGLEFVNNGNVEFNADYGTRPANFSYTVDSASGKLVISGTSNASQPIWGPLTDAPVLTIKVKAPEYGRAAISIDDAQLSYVENETSFTLPSPNSSANVTVELRPESHWIAFESEVTKAAIVALFDSGHNGELSYDEAAAVTNQTMFQVRQQLKEATLEQFDEFRYFTGVTDLFGAGNP
ncbi:MAG: hypothetical protein IJ160_08920, partial [Muribaculaceae bacterium]|nr:hypothetical protein [Muribaculaceae bacterium]